MEKKFEQIIKEGKAEGKTYEQINAELKAAGANFHLDDDGRIVDPGEGFIEQPEKTEDVQREIDKTRRPDLANGTDTQHVNGHDFKVWYNENGYVWKVKKVD